MLNYSALANPFEVERVRESIVQGLPYWAQLDLAELLLCHGRCGNFDELIRSMRLRLITRRGLIRDYSGERGPFTYWSYGIGAKPWIWKDGGRLTRFRVLGVTEWDYPRGLTPAWWNRAAPSSYDGYLSSLYDGYR